ncbi:MAG TPA: TraB/GumN family protein [Caulobacteraceae bacterium]|nr:TraB/GumN family protein [Caulobacteraceae bacterium]
MALAACCLLGAARPALAQPSVWVVHGESCTITLFGSIHVLPPGLTWEPPALVQALDQADELWFEIPLGADAQAQAASKAQVRGALPDGQTLSGLMSPQGARRLSAFAAEHRLSLAKLNHMQPWFADLVVSSFAYAKSGGAAQDGVEDQLAQAAPQAPRKAFETAEQQIDMIADAPQKAQVASLEASLREAATDPDEYTRLVDAWMRGDGGEIYRHDILTLRRDAPDLFKILITQRNAAWTSVLAERLKAPGHVVVVVGAAHLLGPDGVPARLRALGFKVDGPTK